jgi:hypothetical protein
LLLVRVPDLPITTGKVIPTEVLLKLWTDGLCNYCVGLG